MISLAKSAGFCFGVNRAVNIVNSLINENKKVATLGPIIHNPQLVKELEEKGVIIVDFPENTPEDYILVIRSHGVPKSVIAFLQQNNIKYIDATCPFVSKIHRIVETQAGDDSFILIAGDPDHAEVQGIVGYSGKNFRVFTDDIDLENFFSRFEQNNQKSLSVVAQTTFNTQTWQECEKKIKKRYTNTKIFDTICDATTIRQNESIRLAKTSDLMIIIGGKQSSNTRKLFDICNEFTKTILIETAAELNTSVLNGFERIGVTAGASTPAVIIKEVLKTMSEILETKEIKSMDEMSFEEALEASLSGLNTDQKVKGYVIKVGPTEVQVDIGRKHAGYIPADELSYDTTLSPSDIVKVGDVIDLIVMKTNDQEGVVTLSKRRFDAAKGFEKIEEAEGTDTLLDGTVTQVIKGGVIVVSNGVKVFVPASQATVSRSDSLEELVGKQVKFRILEIGRRRRVIGSFRDSLKEERMAAKAEAWSKLVVGEKYKGTVKSLTNYGAFVDIGGVDGMIHVSELAWRRIKHPSDILNVGDEVEVYIKELDTEKQKISLGYRKAEDNPWAILREKYSEGDIVDAKIVSMTTYGAFANIIEGIDGLIHISQIADRRIEKPQDELKVGQVVQVKIIGIDYDTKRVSLSIRALLEPTNEEATEESAEAVE